MIFHDSFWKADSQHQSRHSVQTSMPVCWHRNSTLDTASPYFTRKLIPPAPTSTTQAVISSHSCILQSAIRSPSFECPRIVAGSLWMKRHQLNYRPTSILGNLFIFWHPSVALCVVKFHSSFSVQQQQHQTAAVADILALRWSPAVLPRVTRQSAAAQQTAFFRLLLTFAPAVSRFSRTPPLFTRVNTQNEYWFRGSR